MISKRNSYLLFYNATASAVGRTETATRVATLHQTQRSTAAKTKTYVEIQASTLMTIGQREDDVEVIVWRNLCSALRLVPFPIEYDPIDME